MAISKAELRLNEAAQALDRSNQEFNALSPAARRVAIARDVLKWLEVGKIRAKTGTYLSSYDIKNDRYTNKEDDRVDGGSCTVCALGAVFACTVERIGGLKDFWSYRDAESIRRELGDHFDDEQLRLIETAFEQGDFTRTTPDYVIGQAIEFATGRPEERLVAIMKNIISNKGEFCP